MDEETRPARNYSDLLWPIVAITVVAILIVIQALRVNTREEVPVTSTPPTTYSMRGALLSGTITIAGGDFVSTRINLNRRAKVSGEFQTGSMKSKVAVFVIDEADFEGWKLQTDFRARVRTGYIPGGKISPVLEPGIYFLIIDNRANPNPQSVQTNFVLD
jgi:hypothetical protein